MSENLGRDELFWRLGHEKSADLLEDLKKVENVIFQDEQGNSYLHIACTNHYLEAIETLLEIGADPNITNKKGFSPIMNVIGRRYDNNAKIFETLLIHGLDLDKQEGNTSLKELIESFGNEELNSLIKKYYQ